MPDQRGWPDPAKPGVPLDPHLDGPHLVVDAYGRRRWAWWVSAAAAWVYAEGLGQGHKWTYIGPAKSPDGMPVG
jgi:hypothetical protein